MGVIFGVHIVQHVGRNVSKAQNEPVMFTVEIWPEWRPLNPEMKTTWELSGLNLGHIPTANFAKYHSRTRHTYPLTEATLFQSDERPPMLDKYDIWCEASMVRSSG